MTKRTLVVTALGLLSLCGVAASASAQPRWGRERMPQNGACFFEDRDFGGRYFCVRPGDDLRSIPSGMNDRVSSIRLLGVSEVTVFRDNDMRGRSAHFTRDVNDLRNDGWNDTISSIAIQNDANNGNGRGRNRDYRDEVGTSGVWNPNDGVWARDGIAPRDGACFYSDTDYRGESFCVARGGTYASLPRGFNDRVASVRVFGGSSVRLYDDRDFRGHSKELRRDSANLKGRWRETISSVRVF
jgi:Peptidase inhibitor family I36